MGKLLYGTPPTEHDVDDRALAHLQIVIVNKFRRDECFPFHLPASTERGVGRQSLWMHPAIPVQFAFLGSRVPTVNPGWVQSLMEEANSGRGLRLTAEPQPGERTLSASEAA